MSFWRKFVAAILVIGLILIFNNTHSIIFGQNKSVTPVYLDPNELVEKRVEDLLGRMTLKEKVGQMNMPCVYKVALGKDIPAKIEGCKNFTKRKPLNLDSITKTLLYITGLWNW